MDTERRSFEPEFRAGAVRIVQETGRPVAQVARDLGINQYTLHNWVKKDRIARGDAPGRPEPVSEVGPTPHASSKKRKRKRRH